MIRFFANLPAIVVLGCIGALAMFPIAFHAAIVDDFTVARPFFYGGVVLTGVWLLVGIAARNWRVRKPVRAMLLTVIGVYLVLPVVLALPLIESVEGISLLDGYLEMMSSLTTTGLSVFQDPEAVPRSVHLWRALVAWLGGLLMWVSAIAIMAPLRLGGFEVMASRVTHSQSGPESMVGYDPNERLIRHAADLTPVYLGLTFLLWVLLLLAGEEPFVALCHAMSTLATSGISPLVSMEEAQSGRLGELAIALFLVFALLRRTFARDMSSNIDLPIWREPELRVAAFIVFCLTAILMLRHWIAAEEGLLPNDLSSLVASAWGAFFTSLSFLTTNGLVSTDWDATQDWAGLSAPGLILMGLALVGGGVATTAGGVKLLRVYILYRHASREMARLVYPSSVSQLGGRGRTILGANALIAWVFFMTFGLSLCATMMALTASGIGFEAATVLSVAAISTTGPLVTAASETAISVADLPDTGKVVLSIAMLLGRLGTLTIVALLNPGFWRL